MNWKAFEIDNSFTAWCDRLVFLVLVILLPAVIVFGQQPPATMPDHVVAYTCTPTQGNGPVVAFKFDPAPYPNVKAVIGPVPNSTDVQPPSIVSITNSANVDLTTGAVKLLAANNGLALTITATDDTGIVTGTLEVDGRLATPFGNGLDKLPTPFYVRWNIATVATGPHTIRLTVWDAAGNPASRTWVMTK